PTAFSLEELSKLWSVFFQTPYTLSVAYHGTVVFIEGEEKHVTPLPVQERVVRAVPFRRPVIEAVQSPAGSREPITADTKLVILGQRLRGEVTTVLVDDVPVAPEGLTDTR